MNAANSEEQDSYITPHAIVQLVQAGMVELDDGGRFLTNRGSTSPRSIRRVYDVDHPKITNIGFYHGSVQGGRWFIESPLDAIYIWGLNGRSWPLQLQIPLNQQSQYSNPKIDPSGNHLVCIKKVSDTNGAIHLWELNEGLPREREPTELGIAALGSQRTGLYEFTANNGLLVMDSARFLRWDLNDPTSAPKEFRLGPDAIHSHRWQMGNWTAEPPYRKRVRPLPFMVWETRKGDWYYTDFPSNPTSPRTAKLNGQPTSVDGRRSLTERDGHFWFCRLNDNGTSDYVQLGNSEYRPPESQEASKTFEHTILPMAYFVGDSGFVLARLRSGFLRDVTRSQTYVVAYDQRKPTPVSVQELNQKQYDSLGSDTFRWGDSGNWLVGRFPDGYRYWDLRESMIPEVGEKLEGLQEPSKSSFVLSGRWLILFGMNGGLYCADLNSDQPLRAKRFFSLGTKDYRFRKYSHVATNRFCVRNLKQNTAYTWNSSQFDLAFGGGSD